MQPHPLKQGAGRIGRHHLPLRAGLLMFGAVGFFSTQDAVMKWLTDDYGVAQIIFSGRILALPMSLLLAWRSGGFGQLRTRRPGWHGLRASLTVADMLMFTTALALLPLADTITIGFAAPILMTALSAPLLGERVGLGRWIAVIVGFVGVLVVMRPTGGGFGLASFYALGSAVCYALIMIVSRRLASTESGPCLIFWNTALVTTAMAVLMLESWVTPDRADLWIFAVNAATGAVAQMLITEAFRSGEISLLAPITYSSLLWAIGLGIVLFDDIPSLTVLIGAAVIIVSTLFVVERRKSAAKPPEATGGG